MTATCKRGGFEIKRILSIILILAISLAPLTVVAQPRDAMPSSHVVYVDGTHVVFRAFNIGGNNFFMLRDIAYVLSGSGSQFDVAWDGARNAISLRTGEPYTVSGGEMPAPEGSAQTATPSTATVYIDNTRANLRAYNIGGNNFFMLRDLSDALGFVVYWNEARNAVIIETIAGTDEPDVWMPGQMAGGGVETPPTAPTMTAAGAVVLSVTTPIEITNRLNAWEGHDISISALNLVPGVTYTITVTGRAINPSNNAAMFLQLARDGSWPWLAAHYVSRSNPEFTLTAALTTEMLFYGLPLTDFEVIRIQTNAQAATMSFTITSILIEPVPSLAAQSAQRARLETSEPSLVEAFADYFMVGNIWQG